MYKIKISRRKCTKKELFLQKNVNDMRFLITDYLKKYPVTLVLILVIWFLSLFTPPETKLNEIKFIDKWTHLLMYGTLTACFWIETFRTHKRPFTFVRWSIMLLLPVMMGGLVELVQAYCTVNRTGDWRDFGANTVGVLLGAGVVCLLGRYINGGK